jgi:hypothetical protein
MSRHLAAWPGVCVAAALPTTQIHHNRAPALTIPPGKCWSQAQAQPSCKDVSCKAGETVNLDKACKSPLSWSGAVWSYAPAGPYTCPPAGQVLQVTATLTLTSATPGGGSCPYTTQAKIVSSGERPMSTPWPFFCPGMLPAHDTALAVTAVVA